LNAVARVLQLHPANRGRVAQCGRAKLSVARCAAANAAELQPGEGCVGVAALDASALDTVGRWRLGPAKKASTPVEALHPLAVTFQIQP
jgi:hypothetical protein